MVIFADQRNCRMKIDFLLFNMSMRHRTKIKRLRIAVFLLINEKQKQTNKKQNKQKTKQNKTKQNTKQKTIKKKQK